MYAKEDVLLEAKNISLIYGKGKKKKQVLNDISLQIKNITRPGMSQGQVISLIGRSGIGKTSLFKILAALLRTNDGGPATGTVLVQDFVEGANGTFLNGMRPAREGDMGVVFQQYILFDDLTVEENFDVAIAHRPLKVTKEEHKRLISEYAEEFGLTEHLNKYPSQLSGGQRQRASIIQQLLNGSYFLLLDEPFSGLDVLMIDKVSKLLNKISQSHEFQTLIIVTHDLEAGVALSDTVFVLGTEEGKEGAVLKAEIDLIERGLAWQPNVKDLPMFRQTINEIKAML